MLCSPTPSCFCTLLLNSSKHKLQPPLCHGDLNIVSVTELADGSLYFSFGVSPRSESSNKVDRLSSSHGEDGSARLAIPSRLPSRFRKQSPIPLPTVQKKIWQEKNLPIQEAAHTAPPTSIGAVKLSSRPKSSFVKCSPIPKGKDVQTTQDAVAGQRISSVLNRSQSASSSKQQIHEGSSKANKRSPSSGTLLHMGNAKKGGCVQKAKIRMEAMRMPPPYSPMDHDLTDNGAPVSSSRSLKKHAGARRPKPKSKRSTARHVDAPAAERISSAQNLPEESPMQKAPSSLDVNIGTELSSVTETNESRDERKHNSRSFDHEHQSESKLIHSDLGKCTLLELKSIAKSRGLKGYSRLKKAELSDLLRRKESGANSDP